MNPLTVDALERALPHIEASVERSNPYGDTADDVLESLVAGEARLWTGRDCCAVTQTTDDVIIWHAGGDMNGLMSLLAFAEDTLRSEGRERLIIQDTRDGWARVLKARGFREVTMLVKDLNE